MKKKRQAPRLPVGRNDEKFSQLALMRELIEAMTRFGAPPVASLPPTPSEPGALPPAITLPSGTVQLTTPPAQFALDAAASGVAIAQAAAGLGAPPSTDSSGKTWDDKARASVLWDETLAQMGRIQQLYGLGSYPFQAKSLPGSEPGV
ncbi:MAG: hypothetical protein HYV95_09280 [Opitutae bacterium]|nr:hypothetical protein [Opitutae bacterium]